MRPFIEKKDILIGSDPEVFLKTNKDAFISAHIFLGRLVKGTKYSPEETDYGAIQVDGTAIELNTNPTPDPAKFAELVKKGVDDTLARFKEHQLSLSRSSVVKLDEMFMNDRRNKPGLTMGCDPDFNAWMMGVPNPRPDEDIPMRSAGGHLHIGWLKDYYDGAHQDEAMAVVRQLDYALGLWSLFADSEGAERRKLYGKAGAFRLKPYGVEYRVLSNFWMFDDKLCKEAHQRAQTAAWLSLRGISFEEEFGLLAMQAIENGVITPDVVACHNKVTGMIQAAA